MSIASLLLEEPTGGSPTGQSDWSLVVEILLPVPSSDAGIWGIGTWGTSKWSVLSWVDITDKVRGISWTRGSDEVYGRPRVGQISMTLDNRDGTLDPWTADAAQFYAPGTILRAGLISPTGINDPYYGVRTWIPQWTGIVEMWAPQIVAAQLDGLDAADRYIEVELAETLRDLAQVDEVALAVPVGAGETAEDRFERLLLAANWRYGTLISAQNVQLPTAYTLQATDMDENRLAELYLTADSSDSQFRTLRDGRAGVTASEYAGTTVSISVDAFPLVLVSWVDIGSSPSVRRLSTLYLDREDSTASTSTSSTVTVAFRPETFRSMSQDTEISNDVIFSAVGRTPQQFEQLNSIARFGRRSYVRSDLLNNDDVYPALFAQYTSIRRALSTLRIEAVTVDTWARPLQQFLATVCAEPGDRAYVKNPIGSGTRGEIFGFVAQVTNRVTPGVSGASIVWETDIRVDTREVLNVTGAQVPATPA